MIRKKSKNNHLRNKRRHFQLLELMIAVFILLLCVVPTVKIFTSIYLSQQEMVRKNDRDHMARRIHAKLMEKLYKREIPLSVVGLSIPVDLQDNDIETQLQKLRYKFSGTFSLVHSHTPQSLGYPTEYLGELVFNLTDIKASSHKEAQEDLYTYLVFIDAGELDNPQLSTHRTKRAKPPRELSEEKDKETK